MSSDPLLVLHAQALAMPIAAFQAWALMHLKSQLPFDRALWGMGAGVSAGKAFINSIHLHRLPPTMMADYTDELRRIDPLAKATSAAVGVAANFCLADAVWQTSHYAPLQRYTRRYGMANVLCLSRFEPISGTHQFITLVRSGELDRFAGDEAQRFEQLGAHAMQAMATCRALLAGELRRALPQNQDWGVGVVDGEGLIHDGSERLVALLKSEWPHWTGPSLPKALHARDGTHWSGERVMVDFMAVHDCWLMKVRSRRAEDSLSEREHTIARRYADGASYKEIAQSLGTAPTTVRAHLRSIYSKLGVTRKTQLAGLLG
jgi:DNA-binding CsgD family transcriptional regulator